MSKRVTATSSEHFDRRRACRYALNMPTYHSNIYFYKDAIGTGETVVVTRTNHVGSLVFDGRLTRITATIISSYVSILL